MLAKEMDLPGWLNFDVVSRSITKWFSYMNGWKETGSKLNQKFSTPVFRADGRFFFRKKNCESRLCLFFSQKKLSIYFEKRTAAVTLYFEGKHFTVVQRVIKSSNLFNVEYLCKLDSFLFYFIQILLIIECMKIA